MTLNKGYHSKSFLPLFSNVSFYRCLSRENISEEALPAYLGTVYNWRVPTPDSFSLWTLIQPRMELNSLFLIFKSLFLNFSWLAWHKSKQDTECNTKLRVIFFTKKKNSFNNPLVYIWLKCLLIKVFLICIQDVQ